VICSDERVATTPERASRPNGGARPTGSPRSAVNHQQLLDIEMAQLEARIPANARQNDGAGKVAALEHRRRVAESEAAAGFATDPHAQLPTWQLDIVLRSYALPAATRTSISAPRKPKGSLRRDSHVVGARRGVIRVVLPETIHRQVNRTMPVQGGSADDQSTDPALHVAGALLHRLIGLVGTILWLGFFLVLAFGGAYLYFVLNPQGFSGASEAAENARSLLLEIWKSVSPIAVVALRVVAPVLLMLGALVLIAFLARRGASPFDLAKLTSDLPSLLAIVIILTICLLPLSGLDVPDVLNNIALVVVGFYFGKREGTGAVESTNTLPEATPSSSVGAGTVTSPSAAPGPVSPLVSP